MSRTILISVLFVSLVCFVCCSKRDSGPVVISTAPATGAAAPIPTETEALPTTPEVTLDTTPVETLPTTSEVEVSMAVEVISTGEADVELTATAEVEIDAGGMDSSSCFRGICLGMSLEQVTQVVTSEVELEVEGQSQSCKPGGVRELPIPRAKAKAKRYVHNNPCGGLMDHATFHFHKDRLIAYYAYFDRRYFHTIDPNVIVGELKELFGEPTREGWYTPGKRGFIEWGDEGRKISLEILGSMPFVLKIVDLTAFCEEQDSTTE